MRIPHIFAATGLVVAAMTASTSAEAQRWHGDNGRGWHDDRGWNGDRGWRGDRGWHGDRGWRGDRDGYGYRGYWHRPYWRHADYGWRYRCWTEWRWHHPVRICR